MITRERKLLKTAMVLALALLVMAPLASFGGVAVSVGIGVPAPGPGYVWVPGCYNASYVWVPGYWALPPFAGAVWFGPHWGFVGGHRVFLRGFWGHGPGFFRGPVFHGGFARGPGFRGPVFRGGFARGPGFRGPVFRGGFAHSPGFHGFVRGGMHGFARHR